jgi:N-acetylmuramoyl-L-alanine amidase
MPYMLNGDLLDIVTEPNLQSGTLFVPLRKVATALGQKVDFESSTYNAIVYAESGDIITLKNGEINAEINGSEMPLQAAPFVENGEMWVPVRFFERVLNISMKADPSNGIVEFSK